MEKNPSLPHPADCRARVPLLTPCAPEKDDLDTRPLATLRCLLKRTV